jgi:hypothetical protein
MRSPKLIFELDPFDKADLLEAHKRIAQLLAALPEAESESVDTPASPPPSWPVPNVLGTGAYAEIPAEIGASQKAVIGLCKHIKYHWKSNEFWPLLAYLAEHGACSREAALSLRGKGPDDKLYQTTDPFNTFWKQAVGQKKIEFFKQPVMPIYDNPTSGTRQSAKGLILHPQVRKVIDELGGIKAIEAMI